MRLGVANNMQALCLGCANGKDWEKQSKTKKIKWFIKRVIKKSDFPVFYALRSIRFP